jgi:hypothetical protein
MLILTATNVTHERARSGKSGKQVLARKDGTADYEVWLGINQQCIWQGSVNRHVRANGAAELLRKIADRMDKK